MSLPNLGIKWCPILLGDPPSPVDAVNACGFKPGELYLLEVITARPYLKPGEWEIVFVFTPKEA